MNNDSKIFRKVYVDNMKDYYETEKVSGFVYLTEGQEKPNEGDYIENHLHILENNPKLTQDKAYHLFLDRTDIESDNIKELEGYLFEWAKGEYHNGNYEIIVDLDDLTEAYENYCKQEKLECIDAQEYLFQSTKCTTNQYEWIKNFCIVWDMIESNE